MTELITYQVAALRAVKHLAANGQDNDVPLRTQLREVIDPEQLAYPMTFDGSSWQQAVEQSIDYAMRYVAQVTRQVPCALVPSMASPKDLATIDPVNTIERTCRFVLVFMGRDVPPSIRDRRLAKEALLTIAPTIVGRDGQLVTDICDSTLNRLVREAFTMMRIYDRADHLRCVERTITEVLTHLVDRKVTLEDHLCDLVSADGLVDLLDQAATAIDVTQP
jgi:hypothetical protein